MKRVAEVKIPSRKETIKNGLLADICGVLIQRINKKSINKTDYNKLKKSVVSHLCSKKSIQLGEFRFSNRAIRIEVIKRLNDNGYSEFVADCLVELSIKDSNVAAFVFAEIVQAGLVKDSIEKLAKLLELIVEKSQSSSLGLDFFSTIYQRSPQHLESSQHLILIIKAINSKSIFAVISSILAGSSKIKDSALVKIIVLEWFLENVETSNVPKEKIYSLIIKSLPQLNTEISNISDDLNQLRIFERGVNVRENLLKLVDELNKQKKQNSGFWKKQKSDLNTMTIETFNTLVAKFQKKALKKTIIETLPTIKAWKHQGEWKSICTRDELTRCLKEFWQANTTDKRIEGVINLFIECDKQLQHDDGKIETVKKELINIKSRCQKYLSIMIHISEESIDSKFLDKTKIRCNLGISYQPNLLPYMKRLMKGKDGGIFDINMVKNFSLKFLTKEEYQELVNKAMEEAVNNRELLCIEQQRFILECFSYVLKKYFLIENKEKLDPKEIPIGIFLQIKKFLQDWQDDKVLKSPVLMEMIDMSIIKCMEALCGSANEKIILGEAFMHDLRIAFSKLNENNEFKYVKYFDHNNLDYVKDAVAEEDDKIGNLNVAKEPSADNILPLKSLNIKEPYQVFIHEGKLWRQCLYEGHLGFECVNTKEDSSHLKEGWVMFTLSKEGKLFLSPDMMVKENEEDKKIAKISQGIYHSSCVAGSCIACTGEFLVENGVVMEVTHCSGHYTPDLVDLCRNLEFLTADMGLQLDENCKIHIINPILLERAEWLENDKERNRMIQCLQICTNCTAKEFFEVAKNYKDLIASELTKLIEILKNLQSDILPLKKLTENLSEINKTIQNKNMNYEKLIKNISGYLNNIGIQNFFSKNKDPKFQELANIIEAVRENIEGDQGGFLKTISFMPESIAMNSVEVLYETQANDFHI